MCLGFHDKTEIHFTHQFFEENNRVLDEELISKLMKKIPEKPLEDGESMFGSSSESLKSGDENNNQIPRNISISSGTFIGSILFNLFFKTRNPRK